MIRTLTIRNIALIEHAFIEFGNGLLVLSGETGAGKSIIIDAVTLLLGGRADRELIRTGSEKASIEAEIRIDEPLPQPLEELLNEEGIEPVDSSLTLFREISRSGRNICRINGTLVTAGLLKDVASSLVNLHGQSEHQFLADEEKHLSYLDRMGGEEHQRLLAIVDQAYQAFITNHRKYAKLVKANEGKERRLNQLKTELEELQSVRIQPGEEKELKEECIRLNRVSRLHERIRHASCALGNGPEGADAYHLLQVAAKDLQDLEHEDPAFSPLAEACTQLAYQLEDILYKIRELQIKYEYDPETLDAAQNRLESVNKVIRRYGKTEEDVLLAQTEISDEYQHLLGLDEAMERTGAEHKKLLQAYRASAKALTESRKQIAAGFRSRMIRELRELGMEHTELEVLFEENRSGKPVMPSSAGDDRIRLMISPNPGEPLKPLAKIASGGELSRLMLAMKTIEAEHHSNLQTMVFDEIDTGISGQMAQAVAEKMIAISRNQQVICISHLPQIAAAGDHHFLVRKTVRDGRTATEVRELAEEERKQEIARMISGAGGVDTDALQYAGSLLAASSGKKRNMSLRTDTD